MSCPDWLTLIERREHDAEGELLWDRALEHIDGCEACRETAYAAEPTLIFRRLPALMPEQHEIDDMKQAVAALRRAQPIVEPVRTRRRFRRFDSATLMRAAAAFAMVAGSVALYGILGPGGLDPRVEPATVVTSPAAAEKPGSPDGVQAAQELGLRIEIHVLQASKVDRPVPMVDAPSPELLAKLRDVLDYEGFQVLAQGDVSSREGNEEIAALGRGFKASFKTSEVRTDGTVKLRDFEMEKISVVKGGPRTPVRMFLYSELEVSLTSPLTLTVAPSDPDRDALVLAITCRLENVSASR